MSPVPLAAAIFAAAFLFRVVIAWRAGYFSTIEPDEMVKIGYSLATTGRFADPYLIPTGLTAHTMPVYPLFLALIFKLFGTGVAGESVKVLIACATSALRCALLPSFARAVKLPERVGVIAGVSSVFYLSALQTEIRGSWDHPWLALALMGLTWMTIRIWRLQEWKQRIPWEYALAWGVGILMYASFLPLLLCLLLIGGFNCARADARRYLLLSMLILLSVAAVSLPWIVRNQRALGAWVLTRSNLGLELWVSNGPGAAFDMATNLSWRRPHPSVSQDEARLVAASGEAAYNHRRLREALAWIQENPAEFAALSGRRFLAWWFPPAPPFLRTVMSAGLTVLSLYGLVLLFRADRLTGVVLLATWISLPLFYCVIQWSTKYRLPMEWQLLLTASVGASALWDARAWRRRTAAVQILRM
jgi:hypothetical protein